MKKALLSTLRVICAGAMSLYAVSCYDDSALREDLAGLESEVAGLASRIDSLENRLNDDIKNVNALASSMTALETSLNEAIQTNGAAIQEALEAKLAALEEELAAAIAEGDQTLADALAAEKATVETAIQNLTDGLASVTVDLASVTGDVEDLMATLATLEATIGAKYTELLNTMDKADGVLDGKITDLANAVEAAKKQYADATAALSEELVGKIAEAVAKIAVVDVKVLDDKVVLTLANSETVELSKPLANVDNEGLVTIVTDENGAKYWAVIVNGEPEQLPVAVGADVNLQFQVNDENYLEWSADGENWIPTGAYVAADADKYINIYQGETEEIDWETYEYIKEDFYTVEFGGETYYLPLYKVDNSVVTIKAGKTYFTYGEAKTIDVALSDITSMYVMAKPDGWRANLDGKKLTVTAPAEAAIAAGYAEANGEVLLHCTTAEGKCKIAKLAVATTPGFSLTVSKDGTLVITNPEVVTQVDMWGNENTDFNDAFIGLAEVAAFEADPIAYVSGIQDNRDAQWYYINNWKTNSVEYDDDWNPIYKIGGAYTPGTYEVDVIETTVPEMYADWTYGDEIPATPFVVWACPMDENGQARIDDLVYAYYYPSIKATISEVEATATGIEVSVAVSGASQFYVGAVTEEMTYGFPIDAYMQMQEGPFGYFQMALQYGMQASAFQQMGMPFTSEEMPESINVTDLLGGSLMPNTKVYMWVFPIAEGVELADYTYEENLKPYIYEFTTGSLSAGGSATVEFGEADLRFAYMSVELSATEGAEMIYYSWMDADTYNAMGDAQLAEYLLANGLVLAGDQGLAVNDNQVTPGAEFILATLAVDAEFMYGEPVAEQFAAPSITFSETFTATIGEAAPEAYYSGYKYDFPILVEGGDVAKYYYVFSTTEYTDEALANLPLIYDYDYNFKSTTNVSAGKVAGLYANAGQTYYFAVVAESTTGELSKVAKMTVEVPAAE